MQQGRCRAEEGRLQKAAGFFAGGVRAAMMAALGLPLFCAAAPAQTIAVNYDEAKVGSYTLPDPLILEDGRPVETAAGWKLRRQELLKLFEENVFGRTPPPPRKLHFHVDEAHGYALDGEAIRQQVTIFFSGKKDGPQAHLLIYIPAGAAQPVATFLTLNFFGNQSVISDPGVPLPMIWNWKTHVRERAAETSRGKDKEFDIEKILARGYGFATLYYQDLEPDFKGGYKYGIRPLFFKPGQTEPAPGEWGAIGAWAYGLSRAMDFLERDKYLDAKRVAIMGHSRLGKTVLWAAAQDLRFAMVLSSCSGEGGASLVRRNYGERIHNLTDTFPYWFSLDLKRYAGHSDQLPVDAHELIALIAPRPVYVTGAMDDRWADPKGEFLACVAAEPVYRLLGAQGLGTDRMPPLNRPIMHTIAFHIRSGKHAVTAFDWEQFLRFADLYLPGD